MDAHWLDTLLESVVGTVLDVVPIVGVLVVFQLAAGSGGFAAGLMGVALLVSNPWVHTAAGNTTPVLVLAEPGAPQRAP